MSAPVHTGIFLLGAENLEVGRLETNGDMEALHCDVRVGWSAIRPVHWSTQRVVFHTNTLFVGIL